MDELSVSYRHIRDHKIVHFFNYKGGEGKGGVQDSAIMFFGSAKQFILGTNISKFILVKE